jgi:hypothetical protein
MRTNRDAVCAYGMRLSRVVGSVIRTGAARQVKAGRTTTFALQGNASVYLALVIRKNSSAAGDRREA